jgi:hypothetical protein
MSERVNMDGAEFSNDNYGKLDFHPVTQAPSSWGHIRDVSRFTQVIFFQTTSGVKQSVWGGKGGA